MPRRSSRAPTDDGGPPPASGGTVVAGGTPGTPGAGGPSQGGIYRIDANGFHELYWTAPGEAIYSMILLPDGNLLAGTGEKAGFIPWPAQPLVAFAENQRRGPSVGLLPEAANPKQYFAPPAIRENCTGLISRWRQRHLHVQGFRRKTKKPVGQTASRRQCSRQHHARIFHPFRQHGETGKDVERLVRAGAARA